MRLKIIVIGLIFFFLISNNWSLEKPKIKKNLIATTEDGRKVLLKTDGTWEFIKEQKPVKSWREIAKWKGSSIKNTETFHVSTTEWRISWATQPGEYGDMNFQIYVYKNGELVSLAANIIGKGSDISYMRGSGDYYLMINTAQPYVIIVEEK